MRGKGHATHPVGSEDLERGENLFETLYLEAGRPSYGKDIVPSES